MTSIHLITEIDAPIEVVFDISRNIDIHQVSASQTNERAIAGVTTGLINLNETVTWRAKHFGLYLKHESKITAMDFHTYFVDEMVKGCFSTFRHEHIFNIQNNKTIMTDQLRYETPYGICGRWFDRNFLKSYLTAFLETRNNTIKNLAEKQQ